MSKVAKWIFPVFGGKDGVVGTAKAVVGFLTGNAGMVMDGFRQVMGAGKKGDAQARQASILTLKLGESPREAVLGVACTAGSLIDVFNFGGQYGTDKVTRCIALADHAIDGVVGFYINEVYHPWVGEGQQAAFSNKLSFHFRNATADGHIPPEHVRDNSDWGFTDRLVGLTHMWIDWYVDDKVWPQGHPEIRFVLRGLRVYDPRFDPQFGYSGPNPQTWADRSSHGFSRNAKVLRYAYTRGIFAEGHHGDPAYLLIGRGLTEEEAPADLVIADANLCDEIVDGVARYCADGVISAAQPFIEVDGMFAAAMAGVIVQREGTVDVEAGQAKAVVATFTDADLVIGEKVGFSRFLGDQDGGRLNTFIARYIEPLMGWKDHSAPVLRDLADVQADGGPREATVSLSLVTEIKQALRVIEINRLLARLERRATVVLPPRFAGLEEGDWVAWQSVRRHKGATYIYRIEAYREPETWRKYLTLRQISATVFGGVDTIADQASPPPPPQVIDALQLQGVTAEAITLPGENSVVPAVRFRWTAPVDAAVQAVLAEVRRVGTTDAAPTRTEKVNDGVMIATNGVGPDQGLECRLVPFGDPTRPVLASNWITVSTSGLVAGDVSATSPTIAQIDADIAALFGDVFDVSEDLSDARNTLDAQGVEIAAARGGQANLNARIVQVNQARIDGDTSNATAISGLLSRTDLTESDILDLEIALATQTASSAEAISQVSARQAAPVNEFDGSDTSQGLKAVQRRWNGPDNVPLGLGVNDNGSFAIYKTGVGQSFGSDTVLGSVSLSGGPFNLLSGAPGAWRVFFGERIGVALEITSASGTPASILCEARYYNNAGSLISTLASFRHTYGAPGFARVGKVFNAPGDGYIQIEAYLIRQGYSAGATVFADTAIRRMTFARLPASWPETLVPAYAAPGNGVLSAQVTQHSASIIDLELQAAIASYEVAAAASGGLPAILRLVSSTAGGYAALAAPIVALMNTTPGGAPLVALQAVDGKVQVTNSVEIGVGASGTTIQSAATGARVVIKNSQIAMYDG